MPVLSKKNIREYLQNQRVLSCKKDTLLRVEEINTGLISKVFKVELEKQTLFVKQAIQNDSEQEIIKIKGTPKDFELLYGSDRQFVEVKALKIFRQYLPDFVPELYLFDENNNTLILSGLGDNNSLLLSESFDKEINPKITERLAANIAIIGNNTYGKVYVLRRPAVEQNIRKLIYKYEVREVWNKLDKSYKDIVFDKIKEFEAKSLTLNKVLVHGDFQERNILLSGDNCWTFDLEEAHIGDPVEDIGKLAASYILRIFFFNEIKESAKKDAILLLRTFFDNLKIPEDISKLQDRLGILIAGCLMLRIDGISSAWLNWNNETSKKKVRNFSLLLIKNPTRFFNLIDRI